MKKLFLIILISFISSLFGFSAGTKYFTLTRAQAFNKGERENITVTQEGYLKLSSSLKKYYKNNDLLINDIVSDKSGNIYFATGNEGKIYKRTPNGKVKLFFNTKSLNVVSLAISNKGIYAAVIPESQIWFISFSGKAKKIAKFSEKYIWEIEINSKGDLYVVCGDKAALYKVNHTGNKTLIYKNTKDNHFQALKIYKNLVYFASQGIGALYQYNEDTKKVKVIYETYEKEITAIDVNSLGEVFFVTGTTNKLKLPRNNFDYTDTFVRQLKGPKKLSKNTKYLKNSVYVYNTRKVVEKLFTKNNFLFHSISVVGKRNVFIGSGTMGVIFKITSSGKAYYLYRLDENQILCFYKINKNNVLVGTGNPGRAYLMSTSFAKKGTYTSPVYDAKADARWGKINVEMSQPNGTSIVLETRTGNTSSPDNTWSNWSNCGEENQIKSPEGRYLQYRLTLKTSVRNRSPEIWKILIPFVRNNRAPQIATFVFKRGVARKKTGSRDFNICRLSWSSFDPDHDPLWYRLYVKPKGFTRWTLLIEKTKKLSVTFDSRMFPDGVYEFKVLASDSLNNPASHVLQGEKISNPIIIDNTPPEVRSINIRKVSNKKWTLSFSCIDKLSNIAKVQISVNYGNWKIISPKDGIFDSKKENFYYEILLKNYEKIVNGENSIVLKIYDLSGNMKTIIKRFNR